jgi:hypothetical protein
LGTGDRNDVICPREITIPVSDSYKMSENDNIRAHTVSVSAGDQTSACVIEVIGGNKANSRRLLYTWGSNIFGEFSSLLTLIFFQAAWVMETMKIA